MKEVLLVAKGKLMAVKAEGLKSGLAPVPGREGGG